MLDQLLDCGRYLPVLTLVLSWSSPITWVRLRCARAGFRKELRDEHLRVLAKSVHFQGGAADLTKKLSVLLSQDQTIDEEQHEHVMETEADEQLDFDDENNMNTVCEMTCSQARRNSISQDPLEVAFCECALLALLEGVDMNTVEPTTKISTLMRVAEMGYWRVCYLLVSQNADVNAESIGGATALSLAITSLHTSQRRTSADYLRSALLLVRHTRKGLPDALTAATRMAMQDDVCLPLLDAIITQASTPIHVDAAVTGPDGRIGTALSAALERRVKPVESALVHRANVVSRLLALRADPGRRGPYKSWWGGPSAQGLLGFAAINGCDNATLEILRQAGASLNP